MRRTGMLGLSLGALIAFSVAASASAATNLRADAHSGVTSKPPKAQTYEYCEKGSCFETVHVLLYSKTKHWEVPGYEPSGSHFKSGKNWIFRFESSFNNGCEFVMKKVKKNYVGEAQSNCYSPNVSEEFRYLS